MAATMAARRLDADGEFLIAFGSNGIFFRQYPQGTEFNVNTFPGTQYAPAVAMDAVGNAVIVWDSPGQDGSGDGVYAQRYHETSDTAAPIVSDVTVNGQRVASQPLRDVSQLVVSFSENLSTTGGITGSNSVTNRANWGLTQSGIDISAQIASVAFAFNSLTHQYQATLTFTPVLADGDYVLTARQSLADLAGNALDGDLDGIPGGNFLRAFSVRPPVKLGPEFQVSFSFSADSPSIARNANGNFVVAWETIRTDGFAISAQLYTSSGAAVGGEIYVNNVSLNTFSFSTQITSVAMDANGGFVIAWEGISSTDSPEIYARRFNSAGIAVGSQFGVNQFTTGAQTQPSVAMDEAGDFVIAWQSDGQDGSFYGIYAKRYSAAGVELPPPPLVPLGAGNEFRVNSATSGNQRRPSVAVAAGGDFVIAWQNTVQNAAGNFGIYAQRYSAAGAAIGAEIPVHPATSDNNFRPSVAMDSAGDFVIAWTGYGGLSGFGQDVHARRYAAAQAVLDAEFIVNTYRSDSQSLPSVAMDRGGESVITWWSIGQDGPGRLGIHGQRFTASGAAAGGEFFVSRLESSYSPSTAVAIDAAADFVVAWESSGQGGIRAQRFGANEAPSTLGIPAVTANDYSPNTLIELFPRFADSTDPAAALTFSIAANTNPSLFDSTSIDSATGILTLDYSPGHSGAANITIRATDTGGLFIETTFLVNVTASIPPTLTASAFIYGTAPQRLTFTFSQDVHATLHASNLIVQRLTPDTATISISEPIWDSATNTATFNFTGILPDGDYRATLSGTTINAGGPSMTSSPILNFFFLQGDLNGDRQVSIADFITLASNFNKTNSIYSDGDLNYDGIVSISDFIDLAANFNKTLGAPPPQLSPAQPPAAAEIIASTPDDLLGKKRSHPPFSKPSHRRHPHHPKNHHHLLRFAR
jgi:hypothetical protein